MALLDLVTRQDYEVLAAKLDAVLARLEQPPAAPAADELLSVEQVAAYTRFDRRTVEQWVKEGRFDERGKRVYLPAFQYNGRLRFKRGDVEAFGLGIGVLTPSPAAGQRPAPTKPAPAKKTVRKPKDPPGPALRVAS